MKNFLSSIFLLLHLGGLPSPRVALSKTPQLIIWNVGQGQWVSLSLKNSCLHFDMGGENIDWSALSSECGEKANYAFFSHWDIDHLSFAKKAGLRLKNFCVAAPPNGPPSSERKSEIFNQLRSCSQDIQFKEVFELEFSRESVRNYKSLSRRGLKKKSALTSNDYSRVFEYDKSILIQGDSPKRQEQLWRHKILSAPNIKFIVLGHHGSRTSSSDQLFHQLPNLKMAIASARQKRYGHPHEEVLRRLKKFGVSCLQTEFWGNIRIELSNLKKDTRGSEAGLRKQAQEQATETETAKPINPARCQQTAFPQEPYSINRPNFKKKSASNVRSFNSNYF